MQFRKVLFWLHLLGGCVAGAIILLMSLTGVLLTYERQIVAALERGPYRAPAPAATPRLPVDQILDTVRQKYGELPPGATLTLRSDPSEPVEIRLGRDRAIYANPYSGKVEGESAGGTARNFFQKVTAWHRWLGAEGAGRTTARAITGACNLCFLILIVTGAYLWMPRRWSWQAVRSILYFRTGLAGKARDFNWHNVFGIWALIPLFIVLLTALPMSYSWANDLVYRITGTTPPPPVRRGDGPPPGGRPSEARSERPSAPAIGTGYDRMWSRAASQVPNWNSITARIAVSGREPMTFTIDAGTGGEPQKRSTLLLNPATAGVVKFETFADSNRGRRLRIWSRFAHTGEYYGVIGQTVAGAASAAGVMLVWTGVSLALRRFAAWNARRKKSRVPDEEPVPAGVADEA